MRQGYLRKLLAYMKKVFKIEDKLGKLRDSRVNPTYRTSEGILPVLLGFLVNNFEDSSLSQGYLSPDNSDSL